MNTANFLNPDITYNSVDDRGILVLIEMVRKGISFSNFINLIESGPFNLND